MFFVFFLGFGIYYLNSNDEIEVINFDIISTSDTDKQDSESVIRGFRILRKQPFFREIDNNKDYIIWSDVGNHFRNRYLTGYLFKELKSIGIYGKFLN